MGSTGERTSPTIRGTLIRDKFLNDAPSPPPPNVPAIENPKGQKHDTVIVDSQPHRNNYGINNNNNNNIHTH